MSAGQASRAGWRRPPDWLWRTGAFLLAVGLLVVITTGGSRWQSDATWQSTDNAYLQSDLTPIAAKVAGYVRSMPVQDFERVRAGQMIAEIVDDDYRATVAQLTAGVAAATAHVEALNAQRQLQKATVRAALAAVAGTAANLEQSVRDIEREERLLAQLDQLHAQAEASQRQLAVLSAQEEQAKAAVAAQQASLELARLNLGFTRIVAPADGVLGQRQVKPGQYVGVGGQLTTLTPLPRVWVIANFKETQLTHMEVGQPADIKVDTFPGHVLRGHVAAVAPAAGSQFALLPPDNATGNFTKVVQRVAVKIVIDDADGIADRLRPGLSVVARVDTSRRNGT